MKFRVQARNPEGKLVAMIVRTTDEITAAVNKAGALGYTEIESEPLPRDPTDPETWDVVPPKPPCSEATPCHGCSACHVRAVSAIGKDPTFRDHMAGFVDKPREPIPSADGGGQWIPDPEKPTHYTFGSLPTERTISLTAAFVATLPTGERVELPAGTVLRKASTPIQLASAEEERAILPRATRVEVRSRAGSPTTVTIEDDAGRTIRLVHVGAAEAMRFGEPVEPRT